MNLYYNTYNGIMTLWQERPFMWADGSPGVTKERIAVVDIKAGRCDCEAAHCPHVKLVREIAKGD